MVGASGREGLRASAKIPITRTDGPAAAAEASVTLAKSTCPPINWPIRSPSPRNGTWLNLTLADVGQRSPGKMGDGADRSRGKGDAVLGPRRFDDVARGLERRIRAHDQRHLVLEGLTDRREGFVGVADVALHQRQHRIGQRRDEQQRVAVRRRARDIGNAERAAGAGAIGDHEGLLEVRREALGHRAQQQVDAAAGRVGDDEIDAALGIFRGAQIRRHDACRKQRRRGHAVL